MFHPPEDESSDCPPEFAKPDQVPGVFRIVEAIGMHGPLGQLAGCVGLVTDIHLDVVTDCIFKPGETPGVGLFGGRPGERADIEEVVFRQGFGEGLQHFVECPADLVVIGRPCIIGKHLFRCHEGPCLPFVEECRRQEPPLRFVVEPAPLLVIGDGSAKHHLHVGDVPLYGLGADFEVPGK